MSKTSVFVFTVAIVFFVAADVSAVLTASKGNYDTPSAVPAEIHGFKYVAGLAHVDSESSGDYRPSIWAELSKKEVAFRRQRIDQATLNEKQRKLEQIDLLRIPYKKIEAVWYGEDALKKIAVTKLPTASKNIWDHRYSSFRPMESALDQRYRSPVVIIYNVNRKEKGSIVIMGPTEKSLALYNLLVSKLD